MKLRPEVLLQLVEEENHLMVVVEIKLERVEGQQEMKVEVMLALTEVEKLEGMAEEKLGLMVEVTLVVLSMPVVVTKEVMEEGQQGQLEEGIEEVELKNLMVLMMMVDQ